MTVITVIKERPDTVTLILSSRWGKLGMRSVKFQVHKIQKKPVLPSLSWGESASKGSFSQLSPGCVLCKVVGKH